VSGGLPEGLSRALPNGAAETPCVSPSPQSGALGCPGAQCDGPVAARPSVSLLSFVSAPAALQESGLLGWLGLSVGDLVILDGIALRRSRAGELILSFPVRTDGRGRRSATVRPMDAGAAAYIVGQVLSAFEGVGEAGLSMSLGVLP